MITRETHHWTEADRLDGSRLLEQGQDILQTRERERERSVRVRRRRSIHRLTEAPSSSSWPADSPQTPSASVWSAPLRCSCSFCVCQVAPLPPRPDACAWLSSHSSVPHRLRSAARSLCEPHESIMTAADRSVCVVCVSADHWPVLELLLRRRESLRSLDLFVDRTGTLDIRRRGGFRLRLMREEQNYELNAFISTLWSSDELTLGAGTKTRVFSEEAEENKADKAPGLCCSGNRLPDTWPTV